MSRLVAPIDDVRVDRVVADGAGVAMAVARRLCGDGRVRGDRGQRLAAGDRLTAGTVIVVEDQPWLQPVDAPLSVLWFDEDVAVVDKPAGLPCHPIDPGEADSVVHRLMARFPEVATASPDAREGGLVHRLDTGTSGCLAVARSREAWRSLRAAVDDADKTYLALVAGAPLALDGTVLVDRIAHDRTDRRRMTVVPDGADHDDDVGQTGVVVLGRGRLDGVEVGLVRLALHGGRRHQLRVQLASRGHPLVGDQLYGGPLVGDASGPLLHAWRLALPGKPPVTAGLPGPFRAALEAAGVAIPT